MNDTYTLPNTTVGLALRAGLAEGLTRCGITYQEWEEPTEGATNGALLKLEITGKRPGAGRIAKDMKERKQS
jgi:hypothetical protein